MRLSSYLVRRASGILFLPFLGVSSLDLGRSARGGLFLSQAAFSVSDPDSPSTWLEGFLKLSPSNPPRPGFRADTWREVHANAKAFLDTRCAEAANKGWTGLRLFGVNSIVGIANVGSCGALMLSSGAVEEITAEWINFGRTRFYRAAPQQSAVLVWRFGA